MERLRGVPLTDLESIRRVTTRDPEAVLISALNVWGASVLGAETFHADVHAGNLLVRGWGLLAGCGAYTKGMLKSRWCHNLGVVDCIHPLHVLAHCTFSGLYSPPASPSLLWAALAYITVTHPLCGKAA